MSRKLYLHFEQIPHSSLDATRVKDSRECDAIVLTAHCYGNAEGAAVERDEPVVAELVYGHEGRNLKLLDYVREIDKREVIGDLCVLGSLQGEEVRMLLEP